MICFAILFGSLIIGAIGVICMKHYIVNLEKMCRALINGRDWKYPLGLLIVQTVGVVVGMMIFKFLMMLE